MNLIKSYFKSDSRCYKCGHIFALTSTRRICKICKNIFCKNCSISLHHKYLGLLKSKRFCNDCFKVTPESISLSSYETLPKQKDFSKTLKSKLKIKHKDPNKDYKIIKEIGSGAVGSVYLAQKEKSEELYALKVINLSPNFEKTRAMNEIGLMQLSTHENVIKCYSAYHNNENITLVLELMDGSIRYLVQSNAKFQEPSIAYICKEVLKGIDWMHQHGRLHRDIKSENILYNMDGEIKITDFGFSAQLTKEYDMRMTIVGTPSYMAPEIITGNGYGQKVDVWAVGILAFELAEGSPPVEGKNKLQVLAEISNSPSPMLKNLDDWSSEFKEFLAKCFEKKPENRPEVTCLLNDPFLIKADRNEFYFLVQNLHSEIK
ncbi:hypothetical protein SteCoe_7398 [Stentor coeruleus]|uniref:Protein kinase domain-containing protein n=1 Tax=Stentor coeruleus TaxID=5963 RepID=A0A1R2CMN8_9CILI|nr:hypothetical protein SteCoe_7398 [Stentor coeruleus]